MALVKKTSSFQHSFLFYASLNPILRRLLEHPSLHGGHICPLYLSQVQMRQNDYFLHVGSLPPKFFQKFSSGSDDVITRINDVIKVNFFHFVNFFAILKIFGHIFC